MDIINNQAKLLTIIQENEWDFGNKILYDLCSNYPDHKEVEVVIAKMLFIGRIYAAAIERRKTKSDINDDFYIDKVAPTLINSELDSKLHSLSNSALEEEKILDMLVVHKYLSDLFNTLTGLDKRSLSSKYLHFHKPLLFFIYDSRAVSGLRTFISRVPPKYKQVLASKDIDIEYGKFFVKAYSVKTEIEEKLSKDLTPRQFDKILINIANKNLSA